MVEDNPGDAFLARSRLAEGHEHTFIVTHASRLEEALEHLQVALPDAVVLDLNLPDSRGLDTLRRLRRAAGEVGIIVLSGSVSSELRQAALLEGAQECIAKQESPARLLARSLAHVVEHNRLRERYRALCGILARAPDALVVLDGEGLVRYCNDATEQLFARRRAQILGRALGVSLQMEGPTEIKFMARGERRVAEICRKSMEWEGRPACLLSIRDTTEQNRSGRQIFQTEKMDALAKLAGHVAHDYDGFVRRIDAQVSNLRDAATDPSLLASLEAMSEAVSGADELTHGLLGFAERRRSEPVSVNLEELIHGVRSKIKARLAADTEFMVLGGAGVWPVLIDPCALEELLLIFADNAREELGVGGSFTIELSNVAFRHPAGLECRDYSCISISSSDQGMPAVALPRVFEPFFSTRGTRHAGLGLATGYGIVRQAGGQLSVESTPGRGTTFTLLFPRHFGHTLVAPEA